MSGSVVFILDYGRKKFALALACLHGQSAMEST
jgi:hypothetical protein